MTGRLLLAALGLSLIPGIACSLLSKGPGATVRAFYLHLGKGEIDAAQQLLSSKVAAQLGAGKMRSVLESTARDIAKKQGISGVEVTREDVQGELASVTVLVTFGDRSTKTDDGKLVKEEGQWKLEASK